MFKSPLGKLVRFFQRSRDGWKRKCVASRKDCRYWAHQARSVAKSRDRWRAQAEASAREVVALKAELAEAQKCAGA